VWGEKGYRGEGVRGDPGSSVRGPGRRDRRSAAVLAALQSSRLAALQQLVGLALPELADEEIAPVQGVRQLLGRHRAGSDPLPLTVVRRGAAGISRLAAGLSRRCSATRTSATPGVIVLLLIDPTRDLRPIFVLLTVAVGTVLAWRFWPWRK